MRKFFKISTVSNDIADMPLKRLRRRMGRPLLIILVLIVVIIALSVALAVTINQSSPVRTENDANAVATASDDELIRSGWIRMEYIQEIADEFGFSAEVLSRLFPGKVIYKGADSTVYEDVDPELPRNSYNWAKNLTWKDGRPAYTADDGTRALLGVDVSHHQKKIDWKRVAADGIGFAMIRVGYRGADQGTIQPDKYAEKNIKGAAAAGISIGAYFFSQATSDTEAIEEADYLINALSGAAVSMPVVFDIEDMGGEASRTDGLTPEQITSLAKAFCDRVAQAGYTPMIYANTRWFVSRMNLSGLNDYQKWLAQYYDSPVYPYEFTMWQYTESGKVDGIEGDADINLYFPPKE